MRISDWSSDVSSSDLYEKYCGTPPEHLLSGLRQAIDMLFEEGLEAVFERHRLLAEATRRAVAIWAEGGVLSLNVVEPAARANSVTTVRLDGFDPQLLRDYCDKICGVMLGEGIDRKSTRLNSSH